MLIKKAITWVCFSVLVLLTGLSVPTAGAADTSGKIKNYVDYFTPGKISDNGTSLNYQLYVPKDYDSSKAYPVLLYLHGAGSRGTDNVTQLSIMMPHFFTTENLEKYPCIIIAPQITSTWATVNTGSVFASVSSYSVDSYPLSVYEELCMKLLDQVCTTYHVDQNRLYITGPSMGGYGTWDLISRFPDKFAAAIPICGGCDSTKAADLSHMAIRTVHGANDTTVPNNGTEAMYKAMARSGVPTVKYFYTKNKLVSTETALFDPADATFIYIEHTDKAHDVWSATYSDPATWEWLFAQVNTYGSCRHTWDAGKVTSDPTCKDAGVMTYTCTQCQQTKRDAIAKLTSHTPGPEATATEDQVCTICGKVLAAATGETTDGTVDETTEDTISETTDGTTGDTADGTTDETTESTAAPADRAEKKGISKIWYAVIAFTAVAVGSAAATVLLWKKRKK